MAFKDILAQIIKWRQQDGSVSYHALKRQFDVGSLDDLKEALAFSHPQARDEKGQGLIGSEESEVARQTIPTPSKPDTRSIQIPQTEATWTETPIPNGERRQLTAMVCDLVGSA